MDDWDLDDPTTNRRKCVPISSLNNARPSHRGADPDPYIHRATHARRVSYDMNMSGLMGGKSELTAVCRL